MIHFLITGETHVQVKKRVGKVDEWVAIRWSKQSKVGEEGWKVVQRIIKADWHFIVGVINWRMCAACRLIEKCSKCERSERRREAIDWFIEVIV